uniref:Uncharacterized protein n=1 Tax=Tanacetum cinerariifolium TaxID=118510 RepID=A0A6L2NY99_TANCI|nr:hypothetical protein [Tanacetum cinerariifolium]
MIDELDRDEGAVLMSEKEEKKAEEVKDITSNAQVEGRQADIYQIDMDHAAKVLSMQEDESEVQEAVESMQEAESGVQEAGEVVATAKLITEVVVAVSETVCAASVSAAAVVPTVTAAPVKVAVPSTKRRRGVNTVGFRLDYFKGMSFDDIRPIFEAKFNANIEFFLKSKKQIEEEMNIALESINETPAQKAAKRRRRNEEVKDVEEIKQHLEIVPDEDDDVYTEATLHARKVPTVDYQIVHFNNKSHYKMILADGTHQLYVSFITLLKKFDREDLESLWTLVKERFSTSNPNNFSDDYLLTILRAMFGRPDG